MVCETIAVADGAGPSVASADARRGLRTAALLLSGLAAHAVVWFFAMFWHRLPLPALVRFSDATSYIAIARMVLTGERNTLAWDERVFFGWPLLFAPAGHFVTLEWACIVGGTLLALIVPLLYDRLTGRFRDALLMTCFTPTWLLQSSLGMSEGAYLVFLLASLWTFQRGRLAGSGLLMAAAALVRPTAVFAWAGMAFVLWRRRAWRQLAMWSALCLLGPLIQIALNLHYYGDWNRQSHLHASPLNLPPGLPAGATQTQFNVPFKALLLTPWQTPTPLWKIAFVYSHVAFVWCAAFVALRRWRDDELSAAMAVWVWLNTLFICCTGPYWGFHSFDRYCVWALPGYVFFLGPLLTRWRGEVAALMIASVPIAASAMTHR